MKKSFATVLFCFLLGCNGGASRVPGQGNNKAPEDTRDEHRDSSLMTREFLVGAYLGPDSENTNDVQYQVMKDAHIDVLQNTPDAGWGLYSKKGNIKILMLAQKYGIKILVNDPRVLGSDDDLEEMVNAYKDYPALAGYFVKDEPFIPGLAIQAATSKKLAVLDPGKIYYVNLNSIDAVPVNYEKDYVEAWVQKVGPANLGYLSFDAYPFACDDKFLDTSFYKTIDIIRRVGLKYNVKTASYLQSMGFSYNNKCYRRRPNANELRQNVYTTLAYGIKYPIWFTFWGFKWKGPGFERITDAIIDTMGNKTDLYIPFRKLNMEMKQLGKTLIDLDARDVYHTHPRIPPGMTAVPTDYLVPLPPDFVIQPEDKSADLIITNFIHRKNGNRYVMIVNKSYEEEKTLSFRVGMNVSQLWRISEITGDAVPVRMDAHHSIEEKFLPGQGRLFLVE